ncbi:hypothetical protein DENSPDRAFT_831623 [Dentipellis sp. KUC8613]|nr:hypothetical protein DENSPDRAFT_831623 [Dentipellis sp. KUC8613]
MDAALPTDPVAASAGEPPAESSTLSKNAQKKARKAALFAERKLERRAREKEARKEKKRLRAERIAAGEEVPDERPKKRTKLNGPKTPFNARVVTDLGFDDKMSEKEVKSLCSQLAYTYSANRNSQTPFSSLLFTSLNGRTFARLESMNDAGYKRWIGTEWWSEGYDQLWSDEKPESSPSEPAPEQQTSEETTRKALAPKESVVYLTADSAEELTELKEGETYIIGGICDHNRYKNLCLDKARDSGIRAAQLPIGRYLAHLPTRKVLTVNQVFEILLKWVETRDWEEAFYAVIPKRKFQNGKPQEDGDGGDDDDAQAEGEGGQLQDEVGTEKAKEEGEQTS